MKTIREWRQRGAHRSTLRNERGAVLVLMAFALVVFLGIAALAVDLGLLFVARSEAQRAADAAAHAGAGFYQFNRDEAATRAFVADFAANNTVRGIPVRLDPDADIDIDAADTRVRVRVLRTQDADDGPIGTLFARVLGFNEVDVSATAAAQLFGATIAECILPIAVPDQYARWDGDPVGPEESFDPNLHFYDQGTTGFRFPQDVGRQLLLRPEGDGATRINPSWWNTVQSRDLDFGTPGSQGLRQAIQSCSDAVFGEGEDSLETAPGNRATLISAFENLIQSDPTAQWELVNGVGCVTSGDGVCRASARLRPVVVFDPRSDIRQGRTSVPVTRLIGVFVESVSGNPNNFQVTTRMARATGIVPGDVGAGPETFLTAIRIVE